MLRERMATCVVPTPALPVSLCVPKVWKFSLGAWREGRRSRSQLGCPRVLVAGMARGTRCWLRFRDDRQGGLQRICGENTPTGSGFLGTEVRNAVFLWEFGARLAVPPAGERAEPAVTYFWYPRGNPSEPLIHKIRVCSKQRCLTVCEINVRKKSKCT